MPKINVVVAKQKNIQVSANATGGSISSSDKSPITLKNFPASAASRFDTLKDVVATGETSGAVPVYDSTIDKYVVQKLSFVDVTGDLDGGTF
jgi:hypothetical protein